MQLKIKEELKNYKAGDIVWVPKVAIALWSSPGTKYTEDLWNIGIIIDVDFDGNTRVYVDGEYEYTHANFIRPMGGSLRLHKKR